MARYKDIKGAGRSQLVPFKPGEHPTARHERRLRENLAMQPRVLEWCQQRGLAWRITNAGHHWQIRGGKLFVEWWPSSAKLVFNKRYDKGIHVHDVDQLIDQLEKVLEATPLPRNDLWPRTGAVEFKPDSKALEAVTTLSPLGDRVVTR